MIKDERPIVVGIGEAVLDCYQDGTNRKELGGAPLIFAYHAAKTHCRGVMVSALGKNGSDKIDDIGNDIKKEVEKQGVSLVYNTVRDKPSGTVDVILKSNDPDKPEYYIEPDAAWSGIKYTNKLKELEKEVKAVYFGTLASSCGGTSKDTIDKFLKAVSEGRVIKAIIKSGALNKDPNVLLKIFDVNLRRDKKRKKRYSEGLIADYIGQCNVLKVNEKELKYLCGVAGIKKEANDKTGEKLMNLYPNVEILVLTKGKKGSTVFWRDDNTHEISSQSIHIRLKPKNTVGAGDAMVGAFVGELLNGKSISDSYYAAVLRSDMVCTNKDKNSMPKFTTTDFFFSYANVDFGIVDFFYNKFKNNGLDVWMDKYCRKAGEEYEMDIENAVKNRRVFVYFSSEAANKSKNVKKELYWARDSYEQDNDKKIVIIKLDDSPYPEELRGFLESFHYTRFRFYESLDNIFNNKLKHLYLY